MRIRPFTEFPPLTVAASMRVFVLTGAGISAESGLSTYRDAGGLWEQYRFEEVSSPEAWQRDPGRVWRFTSMRRADAKRVEPNPAHEALARLEAAIGDRLSLCTQNVDRLHEKAGSKHVHHLHGELFKSRCSSDTCDQEPFEDDAEYESLDDVPLCRCGARIRPHIVWFGEVPFGLHPIKRAVQSCDLFVTIGSSGSVYPAAGLVREIAYRVECGETAKAIYVGPEAPDNAAAFDECRLGVATEVVPSLFDVAPAHH